MSGEGRPSGIEESAVPKRLAKPSCRKCFGRGFTGRLEDGKVVPCVCTFRATLKLMKQAAANAAEKENK